MLPLQAACAYRAEYFLRLLQYGHLGPVVGLEHADPRRVVHRGRRVRPEQGGEALPEIRMRERGSLLQSLLLGMHCRARSYHSTPDSYQMK